MPFEPTRKRCIWIALIAAGIVLELLFLRMHSLYYLKNHAIGFIELALGAGIVYLFALYGFSRTQATRASTILLIFSAMFYHFTDFQRSCIARSALAHGTYAF